MGSLRTTAQLISYELIIGLIILMTVVIVGSFNINDIIIFQESIILAIPLFPLFIIFYISALAETNRPPFDLVESESELVSGAFTEYSSFAFALIFLGEYCAIILISTLINILFIGGYLIPFQLYFFNNLSYIFLQPIVLGIKTSIFLFGFI